MFVGGFLYSLFGMFLAYFVFKQISGVLMVFFVVLATLPTLYITIKKEEELDLRNITEWKLLKEHTKVIVFLMFLFFGITTAFVLAYIFLPAEATNTIFAFQEQAIGTVNANTQGSVTGNLTNGGLFGKIMLNNLKVLFFCILFSLLYGTGAMFILAWNASVIAAAIGGLIKTEIAHAATVVGFTSLTGYFGIAAFGFFRYMTHGIFEILSYFTAGLAGGIISIALIKHNLKEEKILVDALDLILISIGLLVVGAFVEVYITPVLFA